MQTQKDSRLKQDKTEDGEELKFKKKRKLQRLKMMNTRQSHPITMGFGVGRVLGAGMKAVTTSRNSVCSPWEEGGTAMEQDFLCSVLRLQIYMNLLNIKIPINPLELISPWICTEWFCNSRSHFHSSLCDPMTVCIGAKDDVGYRPNLSEGHQAEEGWSKGTGRLLKSHTMLLLSHTPPACKRIHRHKYLPL